MYEKLNKIDLNYHLKHPGKGSEPGDPNAIFYLNGLYHLHYILRHKWNGDHHNLPRKNFPFKHSHSFIHCTSKDMLNWKWKKTKLQPSFTKHGMFSGTGFMTLDKKPAIIYHGENTKQNFIIISKDYNLSKWSSPFPINEKKSKTNFWDPDCFIINNFYYSISGGLKPRLFRSKNLQDWKYLGRFMKYDLDNVFKEEDISCPNFFKIKNRWVLLCISHTHGCRYYIGKWDKERENFIPEKHVRMNWQNNQDSKYYLENRDFFAPESVKTSDGRRVMWSWMRMQNIKNLNILSIPRELDINKNNQLIVKPARELKKLRINKKNFKNLEIKTSTNKLESVIKKNILLVKSDSFELKIKINIKKIKNKRFGFELFSNTKKEGFSIIFQPENKTILVGTTEAPFNLTDLKNHKFLEINIFVDKFIIEVFVNNFQSVVGSYVNYKTNNNISAYCLGESLIIDSITLWNLKQANTGYKEAKKNKIWKVNEKLRIN